MDLIEKLTITSLVGIFIFLLSTTILHEPIDSIFNGIGVFLMAFSFIRFWIWCIEEPDKEIKDWQK